MKKTIILSFLLLLLFQSGHSQAILKGMNYQGVLKDKSGRVMPNSTIALKVNLQSGHGGNTVVHFSEIHRVATNDVGIFTLLIGKGSLVAGSLQNVPWSTENIWMQVGVKFDDETGFSNLSNSELLAVPYAYHAGTASQLAGNYTPYYLSGGNLSGGNTINGSSPVPATSWNVTGNTATNPASEYLGTSDCQDLYIKTNGVERVRIYCAGGVLMSGSLAVGVDLSVGRDMTVNHDLRVKHDASVDNNLTVNKNVNFNTTGGSTINYGPFSVLRSSPTWMTGSLRVDKTTNLNDSLIVENVKPTVFTGTLRVNKATNLYGALTVNSQAPTVLTGTLLGNSDAIFKKSLTLDNYNFNSADSATGAAVVAGGTGILKNLNVGGDLSISGKTELNGKVLIGDVRPSPVPDSGALVVWGGLGIGKQISINKRTHMYDSLTVGGDVKLQKTLTVNDSAFFRNDLEVKGSSIMDGLQQFNGQLTIKDNTLRLADQDTFTNYPMQVQGSSQGIAVKVTGDKTMSNNFISFWNDNGMMGRVEGYRAGEYEFTDEYEFEKNRLERKKEFNIEQLAAATASLVAAGIKFVAAITSSSVCVGLGVCATAPVPSLIASTTLNLAAATILEDNLIIQLIDVSASLDDFNAAALNNNGVVYASGAGDYAEYLQKKDISESIKPGDIVGLKGGKVSLNTDDAERTAVVSINPIVLGNTPSEAEKDKYLKIAFLGQVPVNVIGNVQPGDYILPDGNYMGFGRAVSPKDINSKEIKQIVGVAWTSSQANKLVSVINVAVGLNVNDNQRVVDRLKKEIAALKMEMAQSDAMIRQLVPSYKGADLGVDLTLSDVSANTSAVPISPASNIMYYKYTEQDFAYGFEAAMKQLKEHPDPKIDTKIMKKLEADPGFKQRMVERMSSVVKKQMEMANAVNPKN